MPAALAAIAGRLLASEAAGTFALAGEGAAGVGPALPGAASASKQAANSLLSVTQNLQKTKRAADEAAKGGSSYLDTLKKTHEQYRAGAGVLESVTSKISTVGTTIAATVTAGITSLQALADPIAQLTGLSNPAALDAFSRAVNDDFAVIGRAMLPVTEAFTRAFQKLGVFLVQAEPILNSVAAAFGRMIDQVGDEFLDAVQNSGPILQVMAEALVEVGKEATVAVGGFLKLGKGIRDVINSALSIVGISDGLRALDKSSAKGAAVRDVRQVNSAERVHSEALEKAFKQALSPGGESKDPVDLQIVGNQTLASILGTLTAISGWGPTIQAIAATITAVGGAGRAAAEKAERGAGLGVGGLGGLIASLILRGPGK